MIIFFSKNYLEGNVIWLTLLLALGMFMILSMLFVKITGNARRDNLHTYLVKLWCSRRSSIYTGRSTSITDICVSFFIFTMLCVSNFLDLKKRFQRFICVHLIWHFKIHTKKNMYFYFHYTYYLASFWYIFHNCLYNIFKKESSRST